MEYLSYCVSHNGVNPKNRKIETISNMNPPTYRKKMEVYRCNKLLTQYLAKTVAYVSALN